ncbi:hypothetical protein CFB46_25965 [Burkholderia sp. HI2761]|nr:hypothetical protein CFB46_25965 [Burkholderia sp. HI2761]
MAFHAPPVAGAAPGVAWQDLQFRSRAMCTANLARPGRKRIGVAARNVPLIARKHASAHRTPRVRPVLNFQ